MRVGIVAWWFNRGQGVVARHLRSAISELGHETFVLARPTRATNIRPSWIDTEGVWNQPGITHASDYEIPWAEYEAWADDVSPDVVLFDQNYQFEEIARLREQGVKTVGRFVWEQFSAEHVEPAQAAFDVVYSVIRCEQARYAEFGIESPFVPWGCHPELLAYGPGGSEAPERPADETVRLLFPGGFMSKRKPFKEVLRAFRETSNPELRLTLKAQVERREKQIAKFQRREPRLEVIMEDLDTDAYLKLFAGCDALIAPSRWEGLGLHLYEAAAFGVPVVTNDNPPMNEVVSDGVNGLLIPGIPDGEAKSGIAAFAPDEDALTDAMERLADPALRARLRDGAIAKREELSWSRTVAGLDELLASVAGAASAQTNPGGT